VAAEASARWRADPYPYAAARALVQELGVSEPVAITLVRRGYATPAAARRFLEASESHDPMEFEGMGAVTELILAAISRRQRITVHGDYDVDGVCSTAIAVATLRDLGAECDWHLPSRFDEGYGLSLETVDRLAARGTGLLITVDCGITAAEEVASAKAKGMEVVVTDHHRPGDRLPDCPIIHPELSGYPCTELCATAVAYKLAAALRQAGGEDPTKADRDLDLVALATVADLVPLRGENRSLVRRGLAAARRSRRPGLRALLAASRTAQETLDEGDLAFRIGPRINAAGRLYRADAGVELWLTHDEARAAAIASELETANAERRDTELQVLFAAERARAALPAELAQAPALVLAGEGWHQGVVGIVASRLVERHHRPVVLISLDGDTGRGSGRSIAGFDLLAGLQACRRHLIRFGGHRAAAGVEIAGDSLEAFRQEFIAHVASVLSVEDLAPVQSIDALVGAERLGLGLAEELATLGPFGLGNRGPVLLVPAAEVEDVRPMGEGKHVRFSLRSGTGRAAAVGFGTGGSLALTEGAPHDASINLEANEWNGAVEPRAVLRHLHPVADQPACASPCAGCPERALEEEWWARMNAARREPLEPWPSSEIADRIGATAAQRRETIDRRGASPVAAIGELLSTGERVLALCADVSRRRGLAERAAGPSRFGLGPAVLASGRCATGPMRARLHAQAEMGGLTLADYEALTARPELPEGFEHVVLVDPPPFPHLEQLAAIGRGAPWAAGFIHLAHGPAEVEFALKAHSYAWGLEPELRRIYAAIRQMEAHVDAVELLSGSSRHPRTPEQVGRCLRVLEELGLLVEDENGFPPRLRALSSIRIDLERSPAFRAYRTRLEEGIEWLSGRKQPS
jgi:single-stranded-DNA-specific exonuclease